MGAGGFAGLASGTGSGVWQCLSGLVALAAFGIEIKYFEQLKNGFNAMPMPVDNLISNLAYTVLSALVPES